MKKGINSLDAFLAIMIMLFIVFWMQNFFNLVYENAQDFGVQVTLSTEAMRVGSMMNSFYATNPSPTDYLQLNSSITVFGDKLDCRVTKPRGDANVTIVATYKGTKYNASYPVALQVNYDPLNQKVIA